MYLSHLILQMLRVRITYRCWQHRRSNRLSLDDSISDMPGSNGPLSIQSPKLFVDYCASVRSVGPSIWCLQNIIPQELEGHPLYSQIRSAADFLYGFWPVDYVVLGVVLHVHQRVCSNLQLLGKVVEGGELHL